jgi:tetratricopeptide (TPR) repeat protein
MYLLGRLNEQRGEQRKADMFYFELARRFPSHPINQSVAAHLLTTALEGEGADTAMSTADRLVLLTKRFPRQEESYGKALIQVLRCYAVSGLTDMAQETGARIKVLFERNPDIQAGAKAAVAEIYLGRRKKRAAVELLNQAVAVPQPTRNVWRAWMLLGEVYEHELNFGDAITIYAKIFRECPKTLPECWEARIKMGEIAGYASYEAAPETIFRSVLQSSQPFAVPRLVVSYYTGAIDETEFENRWARYAMPDARVNRYKAQKALLDGKIGKAQSYLSHYLAALPSDSWEYVKTHDFQQMISKR